MRRALAALVLIVVAGCTRTSQTPTGSRATSNVITRQEMVSVGPTDAYDAVQRLRPGFLRPRSTASRTTAYAVVYIDGLRKGSPEVLRGLRASEVAEIRYLSAVDATTRYGLNVEAGVLDVSLVNR